MMGELFENMKEHGEAVSSLFPFRESFYGRLGYVGFPQMRLMEFSPLNLSPILKVDVPGEVEVVHIKEGFDEYWEFLKGIQPTVHGLSLHPESAAVGMRDRGQNWLAVARHNGHILGTMMYSISGYGKELNISQFYYTNSQGKYLLLQWMARHGDHVKTIWLKSQATDLLETWAYDLQLAVHTRFHVNPFHPTPMGRVTIVEYLSGMQVGDGKFSATITDPYCEWNNGTYTFEGSNGELKVSKTSKADFELSIEGLSALVFCGSDPADFVYRGWGNPPEKAQAAMRQMFPSAFPFIHSDF
jgi:predicted acetyltransferase